MNVRERLRHAVRILEDNFPFGDYIDEAFSNEMYSILSALTRFLPVFDGKKLLDIGCGPLDKTCVFQLLGFRCCAVDDLRDPWHLRDDNVSKIAEFAERFGIDFCRQEAGDYTIPFEKASFDVVCALGIIEHLHDSPRDLLNNCGEYLVPGGLLVLVTPNSVNLRKRLSVLIGRTNLPPIDQFFWSIGGWRGHIREYTLRELVYVCREGGFETVWSGTYEHLASTKLPFPASSVYTSMGTIVPSFRSGLLVICRKPPAWRQVNTDDGAYRNALACSLPKGVA